MSDDADREGEEAKDARQLPDEPVAEPEKENDYEKEKDSGRTGRPSAAGPGDPRPATNREHEHDYEQGHEAAVSDDADREGEEAEDARQLPDEPVADLEKENDYEKEKDSGRTGRPSAAGSGDPALQQTASTSTITSKGTRRR